MSYLHGAQRQAGSYTFGNPGRLTSYRHGLGLVAGGHVHGGLGGLGVLGSQVPATGIDGPGYLYNDLSLPADANREVRGLVVRWPTAGVLTAFEDSSFTYLGASDSFDYRLYVDGADLGLATVSIGVAAGAPITLGAANCALPVLCSTGVVSIAPPSLILVAASCAQATACNAGTVIVLPSLFLQAAACGQATASSTAGVVVVPPPIVLAASDCTLIHQCTGGAVLIFGVPGAMGKYCTAAQLAARYGQIEMVQLTNATDPAAVNVNLAQVDDAIADIDAIIDAKLATRYALPLATIPLVLRNIACDLVRARLYEDHITDRVAERERAAMKLLDEISKGSLSLGLDAAAHQTVPTAGPQFTPPNRTFTAASLGDYAP